MNPYSNRNIVEWLRLCAEFFDNDTFAENFGRVFDDDKREYELSHPRIIEAELDGEYGGET